MATPWSLKGSKGPPLLALDEFMILDSGDGDPATKNKRVTLTTVQANLVTSVDANNFSITKLNSISINDASATNTFTILGAELDGNFNVTIPPVTTNDTFILAGIDNTFLKPTTFFNCTLLTSDIMDSGIFTQIADNTASGGRLVGELSRGTSISRNDVQNNDRLYSIQVGGYQNGFQNTANINWNVDGNWTATNFGSSLTISTTPTNDIVPSANIIIKNKVISFEDNDIDNIKSIKLNDSDDTHSYIILGDDLSNDRNVTIPTIDADDTFALLGVPNEFTKRQIITLALSSIDDGLSIGNSDGNLVFGNNTDTALQFAPIISLDSKGSSNPSTTQAVIRAIDDTGTVPAYVINVTRTGGGDITDRQLWQIQNNGTAQVSVAFDGTWDFQGNTITNVVLQSTLSEGSIFVGDESNDSKDFPTGLEPKIDCRVATTANINLSSSSDPNPIDGVTLVNLDRILLKNQTTASQNGIYVAVIATDPTNWVRSADAFDDLLVNNGMFTKITEGTLNGNTAFVLSTPDTPTIVLGTTNLLFNKFIFGDVPFLSQENTFTAENHTFFDTITMTPNAFNDTLLDMFAIGNVTSQAAIILGSRSRGTSSSPTALLNEDLLIEIAVRGFDGANSVNCGTFGYRAAGNFNDDPVNKPTKFIIETNAANTASASIKRLIVGSEGETSFQDNIIQDISSIKLNDASDNNVFTILGAELTGNFDVTIPVVIADDTFVMRGATNTYTGLNIFTSLQLRVDGGSALIDAASFSNTPLDGAGIITQRSRGTLAVPLALLTNDVISIWEALGDTGSGTDEAGNFKFIATQNWSPTVAGTKFQLSNTANGDTTPTLNLEIGQDGTADFQGNNISIGGFRASKRQIFLYHSENNTLDSILLGAGSLTRTGTRTSVLDADGYYVSYTVGGMDAQPDIICPDVSRRNHNFDLTIKFRSPLSTERRLWFGFFTADPSATDAPIAQHIGLRLSTSAGDTGFVLSHADGATQAEESIAVSDTAVHTIRIVADATNNKFSFSFDGAALVDVTTNIPAAAENLDLFIIGQGSNATPVSEFDFWFMNGFADV